MRKIKSTITPVFVFCLIASMGFIFHPSLTFAEGAANTPENLQRSAPAGQDFPGSGTGPGSRTDKLTKMDER